MVVLFGLCGFARAQVTTVRGEDEDEWKRTLKTDTKGRLQGVQAQKVLHNCDLKTGWTALSNDTTGIDEDLDHVEGAKSLEFDKVDGTDNTVFGGIQKTITSVDISHYMENNGFIMVSLNVSATTDIDYCFIRLGTDASNYNEWRVDDDALSVGWQQIRFAFYAPSTAGNLGNGMDAAAITYLALGCAFDLETDLLADIRVDNIAVNTGFQTSADLSSQVSTPAATPNINIVKLDSQPIDIGAGAVGLGTQRNTLASDDPAVVALQIIDDWDEVHDTAVGTDGAMQMSESKDFDGAVVPAVVDTEGDAVRQAASLYGVAYVMPVSEDGSETPLVAHDTPISAANGGSSGLVPVGETKAFDGAVLPNVVDTEGDAARLALSLYGVTYIMPVSEDGSETPLVAHDTPISAANGGSSGFAGMGETKDFDGGAFPNVVDTEGDAARLALSLYGVQYVMLVNEDGSAIGTILTSSEIVDSAAFTPTASYVGMAGFEYDDITPTPVQEGDGGAARMSANRNVYMTMRDSGGAEIGMGVTGAGRGKVNVEYDLILDGCDATTGWAAANDATANLALSANHVGGTGSLTFDKVNGTNFTEAYIEKTLASVNVLDFELHNLLEWLTYLSDLTDVAYAFVRLGDDSSNYSEWRVLDEDLTTGRWNPIGMFVGNMEYAVVGTGIDATDVDYIAVGVSFDLEDDLLAGIAVDEIQLHGSAHTTATIAAEVTSSVTSANINLHKVGNKVVDKGSGVVGTGTQRITQATDDIVSISDDDNANTATNPVYFQPTDGTAVNAVGNPIYAAVSKDTAANAVGNPIHMELSDGAAPFLDNTASPGYVRNQDGDSTTLQDVVASTAAGMSKSLNGAKTESVMYGDNGASLDPVTLGATGEVNVTDTAVRPGEDSSRGLRDVGIKNRSVVEPATQGPTAVDDVGGGVVGDIVFTKRKILGDNSWCVSIKNTGGGSGDVLSDAILLVSSTGAAGDWESMPWVVCDTLASGGGTCSYCSDVARAWIQGEALCGALDDTEVEFTYRARK